MDSSRSRSVGKRGCEQSLEVNDEAPQLKKPKLPALASVIVEAVKLDSLQRFCSSLEPLLRRIVSEEVERALTKLGHAKLPARSSPPRICPVGKNLQLHFKTRMPPHLFTLGKVEGEQGAAIHIVLVDTNTGRVAEEGPESTAKLNVVVLEGDFNDENDDDWTKDHFENHEVKEREGKRPLLTGDLQVVLKEGVGTLGELCFTDNSSWIRSRKFRLGVKVGDGHCEEVRIREGKTEAFAVKDHRGELYKKHYPPALHDEVWRLDRIAKDGALHKKLIMAEIFTVEDFLRHYVRDPQKLRSILGSGMSNKMWENTVEHAKTCVMGGKLYVYYTDETHSTGAVFNHIYELTGLIADGKFLSLESLTHNQKVSVDSLAKRAYENWNKVVEYDNKVLDSLSNSINKPRPLNIADHSLISNHNITTQTENPNPSVVQFIEFSSVSSNLRPETTLNTPTMDYSKLTGSYIPVDWSQPRNSRDLDDLFSADIRLRSSEMLDSEDMQRLLLKTFSMGTSDLAGSSFGHTDEPYYSYEVPSGPPMDRAYRQMGQVYEPEHGRSSGKAFVGWLKLKAALRWGIFIRKQAAERRAQLVELD